MQVSGEYRDGGYQEYTSHVKCESCGSISEVVTESLRCPKLKKWQKRHGTDEQSGRAMLFLMIVTGTSGYAQNVGSRSTEPITIASVVERRWWNDAN